MYSPRVTPHYSPVSGSSSSGLTSEDLSPKRGRQPTIVRNQADDDELWDSIQHEQTSVSTDINHLDLTLYDVCDGIYRRKKDAWRGTGYVPAYEHIGGGAYGKVFIGFKLSEENLPFEQRHYVALKECGMRCLHRQRRRDGSLAMLHPSPTPPFDGVPCDGSIAIETICMRALRHENIVRLMSTFLIEETKCFYILMEYCDAGTVDGLIAKRAASPEVVRYLMRQAVLGVWYMHSQRIAHRDIKPENMLLRVKGHEVILKIADFGLSAIFMVYKDNELFEIKGKSLCGTPSFAAPESLIHHFIREDLRHLLGTFSSIPVYNEDTRPFIPPAHRRRLNVDEILQKTHEMFRMPPLDVYSLGVSMYLLVTGEYPFEDLEWPQKLDLVFRGEAGHHSRMDEEMLDLFHGMTCVDPNRRYKIDEILNHPFFGPHRPSFPPDPVPIGSFEESGKVTYPRLSAVVHHAFPPILPESYAIPVVVSSRSSSDTRTSQTERPPSTLVPVHISGRHSSPTGSPSRAHRSPSPTAGSSSSGVASGQQEEHAFRIPVIVSPRVPSARRSQRTESPATSSPSGMKRSASPDDSRSRRKR